MVQVRVPFAQSQCQQLYHPLPRHPLHHIGLRWIEEPTRFHEDVAVAVAGLLGTTVLPALPLLQQQSNFNRRLNYLLHQSFIFLNVVLHPLPGRLTYFSFLAGRQRIGLRRLPLHFHIPLEAPALVRIAAVRCHRLWAFGRYKIFGNFFNTLPPLFIREVKIFQRQVIRVFDNKTFSLYEIAKCLVVFVMFFDFCCDRRQRSFLLFHIF